MWTYLLGPLLVLLPQRWRRSLLGGLPVNWTQAALVSGTLQGGGGLLVVIGWYLYYIQVAAREQAKVAADAMGQAEAAESLSQAGLSYGMGLASLAAFVMHPLTWVLGYFCVEGTVRFIAAWVNQESYATLPLVVADRLLLAGKRRAYELRVPLVADEVTRGDGREGWDLRVRSCRPKPRWKYPLTVRFGEEYFEVIGGTDEGGTSARPHAYLLRRPPPGGVFHGMDDFDPQAVVREAREEEAAPNFLAVAIRNQFEKYRVRNLEVVADRVLRGDGHEGWHLRVESCRPKPEWTRSRTVRYKRVLYRVEGHYDATSDRPFGYQLRYLPQGEAAYGVLDYVPDEPLRLYGKS